MSLVVQHLILRALIAILLLLLNAYGSVPAGRKALDDLEKFLK